MGAFLTIPAKVTSAQQAAEISIALAERAASEGTFGVGGLMLGPDGKVLFHKMNAVIKDGRLMDPSAHVERQLVDAYFERRAIDRNLPPPNECTVVSQLDPCCMCGGALMKSGFNVLTIALDEYAGVSGTVHGKFDALPASLQPLAKERFGYLGVENNRRYIGSEHALFAGSEISADLEGRAISSFVGSMDKVRDLISKNVDVPPDRLKNPALLLKSTSSIPNQLHIQSGYLHQFTAGSPEEYAVPGANVTHALLKAAKQSKATRGEYDAAALVDPFGNVLMAMPGREILSPAQTPYMLLARAYAKVRADAGEAGAEYLAHPKYCKLVTLFGPGNDAQSFMNIGAYCSTMEREMPQQPNGHWHFMIPRQKSSELADMLSAMPPYVRAVGLAPVQTPDVKMVRACEQAVEQSVGSHATRGRLEETRGVGAVAGNGLQQTKEH